MSKVLVGSKLWTDIRRTAAASSRLDGAVAFLGPSAATILKWPKRTRLLVDLSEAAVSAGVTSARGARALLSLKRKDLQIRSLLGLHAKMLAFDRVAYVGSANLSQSSATLLVEASVRFSRRAEVAHVRKEIERLAKEGDRVVDDRRLDHLVDLEPERRGGEPNGTPIRSSSQREPRWVRDGQSVWVDAIEHAKFQKITEVRQRALASRLEESGEVENADAVQWCVLRRHTYKAIPFDAWLFVWWKPTKRTPYGQIEGPFRCLGGYDLGKRCAGERWTRGEAPVAEKRRSFDGRAVGALSSFFPRAARSTSRAHAEHLHGRLMGGVPIELRSKEDRQAFHRLLVSLARRKG